MYPIWKCIETLTSLFGVKKKNLTIIYQTKMPPKSVKKRKTPTEAELLQRKQRRLESLAKARAAKKAKRDAEKKVEQKVAEAEKTDYAHFNESPPSAPAEYKINLRSYRVGAVPAYK